MRTNRAEKRRAALRKGVAATAPLVTVGAHDAMSAQLIKAYGFDDELLPAVSHVREKHANNPIEADHDRLKSRLRPMRGLKRLPSTRVISAGHAFVDNLRRRPLRARGRRNSKPPVLTAFDELTLGDLTNRDQRSRLPRPRTTQQRHPNNLTGST